MLARMSTQTTRDCHWVRKHGVVLSSPKKTACKSKSTYLVTISPLVVLRAIPSHSCQTLATRQKNRMARPGRCSPDVLVGVLDALLQGRHVRPVLPMLVPEHIGVGTSPDQGGDADAAGGRENMVSPFFVSSWLLRWCCLLRLGARPGVDVPHPASCPPIVQTVPCDCSFPKHAFLRRRPPARKGVLQGNGMGVMSYKMEIFFQRAVQINWSARSFPPRLVSLSFLGCAHQSTRRRAP